MKRPISRIVLSIGLLWGLLGAAQAAEVPPGVHPGQKAGGPGFVGFQLPEAAAREVTLGFPAELRAKSAGPKPEGPDNRIGISRRAELDARPTAGLLPDWNAVEGGFVARFTVRSEGALRLRVGLVVPSSADGMEIRFAPAGAAQAEVLSAGWIRETYGENPGLVWTPSTAGEAQSIELFVPGTRRPSGDTGLVHDVSHLYVDPFASAFETREAKLLSCHQNYSCSTNADIATAGKAVARLVITSPDGSSSFCSGALINDTGGVRRYFATAFHCIGVASEASSLQFGWFYEQQCNAQALVPASTTSQGAQLLRADRQNDFTLVQVTGSIPAGTTLLGWNESNLAAGTGVFGIHHPAGVPKAFSTGGSAGKQTTSARLSSGEVLTVTGNRVEWTTGNTEGGSSGSPLMTGAGIFRGTLSMGPREPACTGTRWALYTDFNLTYPLVRQWLNPSSGQADDFANSASAASTATSYSNAFLKMRLDSAGDQDWLRFDFPQPGVWIVYTRPEPGGASVDTYGRIYASNGTTLLAENDDGPDGAFGTNFAFFLAVNTPGTYYLQVTGFQGATGSFELTSIYDPNDDHSDLPFLGTRLTAGVPTSGRLEASGDSDYFLFDVPAAGLVTIASSGSTDVMAALRDASFTQIAFNDDASATDRNFLISATLPAGRYYLQVVGYDPDTVGPYSVSYTLASGSAANYTGLWWIPSENGWGINTNHQGDVLFATLFTYATDREALWLVASNMARQADGSFTGTLFRTTGPPFAASPWPLTVRATAVGTMTWRFSSPTSAQLVYTFENRTVTKNVVRQEFASPVPTCSPTTGSRAGESNYQDLWWGGPSEDGWGINFTHQGTAIFGTLFTYDNAGRDLWLFAGMPRQADGSFSGPLSYATGPPYFTLPWTAINAGDVGSMTFRPTSGDRGTLTYTVGTTQVVKSILRQDFGLANRPVCR